MPSQLSQTSKTSKVLSVKEKRSKRLAAKSSRLFRRPRGMGRYLLKILKRLNLDMRLSQKLVRVLNSFIFDYSYRLALQCKELEKKLNRTTIKPNTVDFACKLIFSETLAKHINFVSNKAVTRYLDTITTE